MEKIGRFEIVGKLGRGAFGMVYKGKDPVINRLAAIKVMSEATVGDPELVARFKREAEAAGGLQHRNIVTIYDLGEQNGLPYIAMEYLEGRDLERILKERVALTPDQKVDLIAQVSEGLHYAHTKGIVHRDIKPANIRILDDGTVKIMDFGIAKMSSHDMTRTGQFMGTVNYMSPEQIKAKKIDGRSDLFAVGVVFYELLSFRRPFPGDSITAVIYKIVNENPPPLTEVQNTPFDWLEGVVFKCLEKDVTKRWSSCLELSEALRRRQKVAVDQGESAIDATVSLARQKLDAGDLDGALQKLDEVLEHDPENQTVLTHKRRVLATRVVKATDSLVSSGRLEQARDEVLKAIRDIGDTEDLTRTLEGIEGRIKAAESEKLLERAKRALAESRHEAAIELLQKALALDPYNETAKETLAQVSEDKRRSEVEELLAQAVEDFDKGRLDEATGKAERALTIDPHSRDAKNVISAVAAERARSRNKTELQDSLLQAELALKKEEFDKAIQLLEKAVALDPKNAEIQDRLGRAKREKAGADERHAILQFVDEGKALLQQKKFSEATIAFQRALKVDPGWTEAQQGIKAAAARKGSIEEAVERKLPAGLLAGIGIAALLAIGVAGWLLLRPSEALKAIRQAQAQLDAGQLEEAAAGFLAATEKPGKPVEINEAKAKYEALYPRWMEKDDPLKAKAVVDQVGKWKGADAVRDRYVELGSALGKRGIEQKSVDLVKGASASFQEYFRNRYDPVNETEYQRMKDYFSLGEELMTRGMEKGVKVQERLAVLGVAGEIFTFIDPKDPSFNAWDKGAEASRARKELAKVIREVDSFQKEADGLLARARELGTQAAASPDDTALLEKQRDAFREVQRLAEGASRDLAQYVDTERYADLGRGGAQSAQSKIDDIVGRIAGAGRIQALLAAASSFAAGGDLESAMGKYREVLADKDGAGNTAAQNALKEIQAKLDRLRALKTSIPTALASASTADQISAVETDLRAALELSAKDPDLQRYGRELEAKRAGQAELAQVSATLGQIEPLLAADAKPQQAQLDEAQRKLRDVIGKSDNAVVINRAKDLLQKVQLRAVEARIRPLVERAAAAEAAGKLDEALNAWREVQKINNSYPGLDEAKRRITVQLKKDQIVALEKQLEAGGAGWERNRAGFRTLREDLRKLDSKNAILLKWDEVVRKAERQAKFASAQQLLAGRNADGALEALSDLPDDAEVVKLRGEATALRRGLAALAESRSALEGKDFDRARQRAGDARAVAVLAADADRLLGEITTAGRAAAITPPPPVRTPPPAAATPPPAQHTPPPASASTPAVIAAPPPPVAAVADPRPLAAAGRWVEAARALDAGATVDPALAGRIYFNASFIAGCQAKPCSMEDAARWGQKAGGFDDSSSGVKLTNPRWAKYMGQFKSCTDTNFRLVCGTAKLK